MYECKFFSLLRESSSIKVLCVDRTQRKQREITLHYIEVLEIDINKAINRSILYEMRAYYPVVDAVGYLNDDHGNGWLVFIQISLSKYKDHRSLCDLFYKSNLQSKISIYTYYRKMYDIDISFKNILLLYFSPQEKFGNSILPDLQAEIDQLKNTHLKACLSYGILSDKSELYSHSEFQTYFARYFTANC